MEETEIKPNEGEIQTAGEVEKEIEESEDDEDEDE